MAGAKWRDSLASTNSDQMGSSDMAYGSGTLDEKILRNNNDDMEAANKDGHVRGPAGGNADS
jgi:hypothetical protein